MLKKEKSVKNVKKATIPHNDNSVESISKLLCNEAKKLGWARKKRCCEVKTGQASEKLINKKQRFLTDQANEK